MIGPLADHVRDRAPKHIYVMIAPHALPYGGRQRPQPERARLERGEHIHRLARWSDIRRDHPPAKPSADAKTAQIVADPLLAAEAALDRVAVWVEQAASCCYRHSLPVEKSHADLGGLHHRYVRV
jgi:hypothetical protein